MDSKASTYAKYKRGDHASTDRETGTTLPERVLKHVLENAERGNSGSVLKAIDYFSWNVEWTMSIGDVKGVILNKALSDANPQIVLELGAFCGYSAILMARSFKNDTGMVYSIEANSKTAEVARQIVEYAGLSSKIKILIGKSSDVIPTLRSTYNIDKVDFVLMDHWKSLYLDDLILLETEKYLKPGAVVVADNTGMAGSEPYLNHVCESPKYATINHACKVEYSTEKDDGVAVSIFQ